MLACVQPPLPSIFLRGGAAVRRLDFCRPQSEIIVVWNLIFMEASRNPNLLKLDVRSVEFFVKRVSFQTKKLHVREVMMA